MVLQYTLHANDQIYSKTTLFESHRSFFIPTPEPAGDHPKSFVVMHSFLLCFIPSFLFASMPDLSITVVWNVLLVTTGFMVCVTMYLRAHDCFAIFALLLISSSLLIVDLQIHKVRMFLTAVQLHDSLTQNERNAAANHVEELRHMIGNVAHDLKTVSNDYFDNNVFAYLMGTFDSL
jgi:cell division protein FtsW (lipid II flippase)